MTGSLLNILYGYTPGEYIKDKLNPILNPPVPADYGTLTRPQHSIWDELFVYNPGKEVPAKPAEQKQEQPQEQYWPLPAASSGYSFTVPGQKSNVTIPKAPSLKETNAAIDSLQGKGKKKTDAMATIMRALANTRWDDNSATGTNLFNIGMAILGGRGLAKQEELDAQTANEQAAVDLANKKTGMKQEASQQDFRNQLLTTELGMKQAQVQNLIPKIIGNQLLYGTQLPSGDIKYQTQQIGSNKFNTLINLLSQQTQNSTVDVSGAVTRGQVPMDVSNALAPKILAYQQQAISELGASLGLMDDKTKQQMINLKVNQLLSQDPDLQGVMPKLQQMLKQQMIMQEALKRAY